MFGAEGTTDNRWIGCSTAVVLPGRLICPLTRCVSNLGVLPVRAISYRLEINSPENTRIAIRTRIGRVNTRIFQPWSRMVQLCSLAPAHSAHGGEYRQSFQPEQLCRPLRFIWLDKRGNILLTIKG
jgi:hypothetical protein